jgi:hypothetical protein
VNNDRTITYEVAVNFSDEAPTHQFRGVASPGAVAQILRAAADELDPPKARPGGVLRGGSAEGHPDLRDETDEQRVARLAAGDRRVTR